MVTATVFRGRNPMNKTLRQKASPVSTVTQERRPSNAFHPATAEQRHLRRQVTLVDRMTLAKRPKLKIETVFRHDQSASVSIQLK
jgi:hypothetical protein